MKVLAVDFAAGGLDNKAGVTFMILSYIDSIRNLFFGRECYSNKGTDERID